MEHPDASKNAKTAGGQPHQAYAALAAIAKALQLVQVLSAYCDDGLVTLANLAEGAASGGELQTLKEMEEDLPQIDQDNAS